MKHCVPRFCQMRSSIAVSSGARSEAMNLAYSESPGSDKLCMNVHRTCPGLQHYTLLLLS
jgi:hypothetical protein